MKRSLSIYAASIGCYLSSTLPAMAESVVKLPDPSGVTLFGMGIAGVLLGRRLVRGKRKD